MKGTPTIHSVHWFCRLSLIAKYAPSVDNILMSLWEIALYKRYIDDVVILWNGTVESLEVF